MSSRLSYMVSQPEFRPEVVDSVRKIYGPDIGKASVYRVLATFRTKTLWTDFFGMIYDTGGCGFSSASHVLPFTRSGEICVKLSRISPEMEVRAKLTREKLRLHPAPDLNPRLARL